MRHDRLTGGKVDRQAGKRWRRRPRQVPNPDAGRNNTDQEPNERPDSLARTFPAFRRLRRVFPLAAFDDPPQLVLEIARRLPPLVRVFCKALGGHTIQTWRRQWLLLRDRGRVSAHDGRDQARLALAFERSLARHHLIQHRTESKDVERASASFPSSCSGDMY